MNLCLNTYSFLGAFDSQMGNPYLIMTNKNRSRFMPILLGYEQKRVLVAYDETNSTRNLGMYTSMLDMWRGIDCKLVAMSLKGVASAAGMPNIEVDMVLTQVNDDGMNILHVPFMVPDAAIFSIVLDIPLFVGKDVIEKSTMEIKNGIDRDDKDAVMAHIIEEIDSCEQQIISNGNGNCMN
jgi:bifunctional DNase/RNase